MGSLQWYASITRPDLAFGTSNLMGNTSDLRIKHCTMANKLLRKAKGCEPSKIVCVPLDINSLFLELYTDASLANLTDLRSQMGNICFLTDKVNSAKNILEWKSKKIKRVCKSTFSSELLSCSEGLDRILCYNNLLSEIGFKNFLVNCVEKCEGMTLSPHPIECSYGVVK